MIGGEVRNALKGGN